MATGCVMAMKSEEGQVRLFLEPLVAIEDMPCYLEPVSA